MKVQEIILHCTATKEGQDIKAKEIRQWHLKQGWIDIGYHYVIDLDGTIEKGRKETVNGAHCLNHNSKALGVVYVGGLDKNGKAKDTRTVEQKESMYQLCYDLMGKYNLKLDSIHCHNEYAKKSCPCFKIVQFKEEYLKWINKKLNTIKDEENKDI